MYCTVCKTRIDGLGHYKSDLHNLNAHRKLMGYPPLAPEEFDSQSISDDLTIDLNFQGAVCRSERCEDYAKQAGEMPEFTGETCLFCDMRHSFEHYRTHGFADEDAFHLSNMQCHICYERFAESGMLLKHLELEAHRTAVTDGVSLYLENGKVLNPQKMTVPFKVNFKQGKDPKDCKKNRRTI